jgi:hypothetical protein
MAALAGLTLIIGVYPDPFLTPITTYIQGMFHNSPAVVALPSSGGSGIAVPLAKNIMFKSGYGFNSNSVPNSAEEELTPVVHPLVTKVMKSHFYVVG